MTITFIIPDDVGAKFLTAVRWKINRPDLTDARVMNKYLKQCIGNIIDQRKEYVAVGADADALSALRLQANAAQGAAHQLERTYIAKRDAYEATKTPTTVDDE